MKMPVSVVIPTYNRGEKLSRTIRSLIESGESMGGGVEVIVVDDGSPAPAAPIAEAILARHPSSLRCIRQENAGPAAARNTGFRAAVGEIVIFVDDDIFAPADLIRQHVEAHMRFPGSVICGRCPLVTPERETPLFRYVNSRGYDAGADAEEEFTRINSIASGQISFERSGFSREEGIYRDDLATPAAEEFELSLRLQEKGIPIYLATRIVALHDHPMTLESYTRQAYKYGQGYAEVSVKYPRTLSMPEVSAVLSVNGQIKNDDSIKTRIKKGVRSLLSQKAIRQSLTAAVRMTEQASDNASILAPLYNAAIGLHFFAGVRDGLSRFGRKG